MQQQTNELEVLINAYVKLNTLHTEPGTKSHMLAYSIRFLERQIAKLLKEKDTKDHE